MSASDANEAKQDSKPEPSMSVKDIFKSAVNKVKFKASEAATDPKANEAAAEQDPKWVPISDFPTDSQILFGQILSSVSNYYNALEKSSIGAKLNGRISDSRMTEILNKKDKDFLEAGISKDMRTINKDTIVIGTTLYYKLIEAYKNLWLSYYAAAMPDIPLNDFKKFLDDNVPPYPGETGPGGIQMPGISRTAVQSFKKSFMDTITGTGLIIIIVLLCTFIGTLAANDAIGRSSFIRFIYFVYASIPIFSPFVAVYYIYRYIKGTFPKIYAYLPLVQLVAEQGKISGFLLAPFSYIPDLIPGTTKQVMTEVYDTVASGFVFKAEQPTEASTGSSSEPKSDTQPSK